MTSPYITASVCLARSVPRHVTRKAMSLSPFGKAKVAVEAAVTAFRDPERGDMVAALGETTGQRALEHMLSSMRVHPVGRRLLEERPCVADLMEQPGYFDSLGDLPVGSLGRGYHHFMTYHGFEASGRSKVRYIDDPELAFVMQRFREVHDFWHVITGLPTTVMGEISLKWLEAKQTGLPVAKLSAAVGPLRLLPAHRQQLVSKVVPWATSSRLRTNLMNLYYEEILEVPLTTIRRKLNMKQPPLLMDDEGNPFHAMHTIARDDPWRQFDTLTTDKSGDTSGTSDQTQAV